MIIMIIIAVIFDHDNIDQYRKCVAMSITMNDTSLCTNSNLTLAIANTDTTDKFSR